MLRKISPPVMYPKWVIVQCCDELMLLMRVRAVSTDAAESLFIPVRMIQLDSHDLICRRLWQDAQ